MYLNIANIEKISYGRKCICVVISQNESTFNTAFMMSNKLLKMMYFWGVDFRPHKWFLWMWTYDIFCYIHLLCSHIFLIQLFLLFSSPWPTYFWPHLTPSKFCFQICYNRKMPKYYIDSRPCWGDSSCQWLWECHHHCSMSELHDKVRFGRGWPHSMILLVLMEILGPFYFCLIAT